MPNIYLEKDGRIVAEVGSYRAGKEERGDGYVVTAYHIYPISYAAPRLIDIAELKDFRLICETKTRRIRYQISSWGDKYYPVEENGVITSRQAFHCARTEDTFG